MVGAGRDRPPRRHRAASCWSTSGARTRTATRWRTGRSPAASVYAHEPISLGNAADFAAAMAEHGLTEADGRAYLQKMYRRVLDEFASIAGRSGDGHRHDPAGRVRMRGRQGPHRPLDRPGAGPPRRRAVRRSSPAYVSQAPDPGRLREAVGTWWDWEQADLTEPGVGAILAAVEEVMAGALEYLDERYGGAVRYFETAGLPSRRRSTSSASVLWPTHLTERRCCAMIEQSVSSGPDVSSLRLGGPA